MGVCMPGEMRKEVRDEEYMMPTTIVNASQKATKTRPGAAMMSLTFPRWLGKGGEGFL